MAAFRLRNALCRKALGQRPMAGAIVLDGETPEVHTAVLDHSVPCPAFAMS